MIIYGVLMFCWVICKPLGTTRITTAEVTLYWAGSRLPQIRAKSWVWVSGLCSAVNRFASRDSAEAAARAFAGATWQASGIQAVQVLIED